MSIPGPVIRLIVAGALLLGQASLLLRAVYVLDLKERDFPIAKIVLPHQDVSETVAWTHEGALFLLSWAAYVAGIRVLKDKPHSASWALSASVPITLIAAWSPNWIMAMAAGCVAMLVLLFPDVFRGTANSNDTESS